MTDTADELARVLNDAHTRGVCVVPYTDQTGTNYSIEWGEDSTLRSRSVEWDPARKRWLVTDDEDRPGAATRTASDWCARYGIVVHGADGWKGEDAPAWTDPVTLTDFAARIARSSVAGGQLRRLMEDAAKASRP